MHNGKSQIEDIFSEAWQKVVAGDKVESVVAAYPEHATELEPMLRVAAAMRNMPQPTLADDAFARIQQRAQVAARERGEVGRVVPAPIRKEMTAASQPRIASWLASLLPRLPALRLAVGLAVVLLVVVGAAILVLRQPNPRQPLETYNGVITKITANGWIAGDTQVIVDSTTEIHGQPAVGASMVCIGQSLPGERMRALEVWIDGAPGAPTVQPTEPADQQSFTVQQERRMVGVDQSQFGYDL